MWKKVDDRLFVLSQQRMSIICFNQKSMKMWKSLHSRISFYLFFLMIKNGFSLHFQIHIHAFSITRKIMLWFEWINSWKFFMLYRKNQFCVLIAFFQHEFLWPSRFAEFSFIRSFLYLLLLHFSQWSRWKKLDWIFYIPTSGNVLSTQNESIDGMKMVLI